MIKHIVCWTLTGDTLQKEEYARNIQQKLEALNGKIEGLVSLSVHVDLLPSSDGDVVLESTLLDAQALERYQNDPLHLQAASYVRSVTTARYCIDFQI